MSISEPMSTKATLNVFKHHIGYQTNIILSASTSV